MSRSDLTDLEWSALSARFGDDATDARRTLDGLLYRAAYGCTWREVPARYGTAGDLQLWRRHWRATGDLDLVERLLELTRGWPDRRSAGRTRLQFAIRVWSETGSLRRAALLVRLRPAQIRGGWDWLRTHSPA